jgi:hypothetical protein
MNLSFLAPDLGKWDQLDGAQVPDALVLPFFNDERPLRGAAGLCDWRLCGRLSRLLASGRVDGSWGETTLFPPGRRLPFPRLVLVGLGVGDAFDDRLAGEAARHILEVVERLGLSRYAVAPPGRSMGRLSARRALEIYLTRLEEADTQAEVVVVESPAGQKEAADLSRR